MVAPGCAVPCAPLQRALPRVSARPGLWRSATGWRWCPFADQPDAFCQPQQPGRALRRLGGEAVGGRNAMSPIPRSALPPGAAPASISRCWNASSPARPARPAPGAFKHTYPPRLRDIDQPGKDSYRLRCGGRRPGDGGVRPASRPHPGDARGEPSLAALLARFDASALPGSCCWSRGSSITIFQGGAVSRRHRQAPLRSPPMTPGYHRPVKGHAPGELPLPRFWLLTSQRPSPTLRLRLAAPRPGPPAGPAPVPLRPAAGAPAPTRRAGLCARRSEPG